MAYPTGLADEAISAERASRVNGKARAMDLFPMAATVGRAITHYQQRAAVIPAAPTGAKRNVPPNGRSWLAGVGLAFR